LEFHRVSRNKYRHIINIKPSRISIASQARALARYSRFSSYLRALSIRTGDTRHSPDFFWTPQRRRFNGSIMRSYENAMRLRRLLKLKLYPAWRTELRKTGCQLRVNYARRAQKRNSARPLWHFFFPHGDSQRASVMGHHKHPTCRSIMSLSIYISLLFFL